MKDIEYEKDGKRKFAQERFKDKLESVGWKVVEEKKTPKKKTPKKKTPKKKDK